MKNNRKEDSAEKPEAKKPERSIRKRYGIALVNGALCMSFIRPSKASRKPINAKPVNCFMGKTASFEETNPTAEPKIAVRIGRAAIYGVLKPLDFEKYLFESLKPAHIPIWQKMKAASRLRFKAERDTGTP